MARKIVSTTLDEILYKDIKRLALEIDKKANDLIEEGMRLILDKYKFDKHNDDDKENK